MTGAMPEAPSVGERVRATGRPRSVAVMRQRWSELLFLHWEAPPAALRALLPGGLDLDLHEGRAFVGLVPFQVTGVRPPVLPALPWLSRFDEVNVRTYVHRGGREPGVWFFSLDASTRLGVAAARAFFHLPYRYAEAALSREGDRRVFRSRRVEGDFGPSCTIGYAPQGEVEEAKPGTLEHFLIERYVLYAADASGRLHHGRVYHAPYPAQGAEVSPLEEDLVAAAGIARGPELPLVHYASAVEVEIFALRPCT